MMGLMGLMGIFRNRVSAGVEAPARDPSHDFWFQAVSGQTAAKVNVTVERARQVPVVRDCLQVLAASVAGLSFGVFERKSGDNRAKVSDHPIAKLIGDPNHEQTSFEFIFSIVDDLAAEGAFMAEIIWDEMTAQPREMSRLQRSEYTVERLPDGSRRVRMQRRGAATRYLVEGEFWYIPLPPLKNNMTGRSPILDDGVETIAAAIALHEFANRFFANDATPPFVFTMDGKFDSEDSKANFLNAWHRWFGGKNRGKPGVLEHGIGTQKMGYTNDESQFIETRKEIGLDVTRLWRVPPHKVGMLDKATFSNIEHQSLEFVIDTLTPWLELIERSIQKWLIDDPRYYFEFNVASLLRGDIKTRFEAYAIGRQWGWLSVNEIRRWENMNGIGRYGDRHIEPLNMTAVDAAPAGQNQQQQAIAFLRQSVQRNGGRPRLEVINNAA